MEKHDCVLCSIKHIQSDHELNLMHALPLITLDDESAPKFSHGALLTLPPELSDKRYIDQLMRGLQTGWNSDNWGYNTYAQRAINGKLYVVPAIVIKGEKIKKRFVGYDQKFTKEQVELYLDQLIRRDNDYKEHAESDLSLLIHDLRQLSTAIYHQAEEARHLIPSKGKNGFTQLSNDERKQLNAKIHNIIASQTMLKIRTDVLDLEGDPSNAPISKTVPIYKRLYKVRRCFDPISRSKKVVIDMSGSSYGTSVGPRAFEIVPYVLLDNAVKYSRPGDNININAADREDKIVFSVESLGPIIRDDEFDRIFQKGFRGQFARQSSTPGSGIGLYLARQIVDAYSGSITVESVKRSGRALNIFTVSVPLTGMDRPNRKQRKQHARSVG